MHGRRTFLLGSALAPLLANCIDGGRVVAAPWHMWSTSAIVDVNPGHLGGIQEFSSPQLASISFGRPDTWSFLFWAQATLQYSAPALAAILQVRFEVQLGLGRTNQIFPDFEEYSIRQADLDPRRLIYTGEVVSLNTRGTGLPAITPIDHVTAQTINVKANFVSDNGAGFQTGQVLVGCFFAPRSHIRPEWFTDQVGDDERYRGGEHGGS